MADMRMLERVKSAIKFMTHFDYERHGHDVEWVDSVVEQAARAAVEALRVPTDEMLEAAANCDRGHLRRRSVRSIILAEYQAMIDAILKEPGQ